MSALDAVKALNMIGRMARDAADGKPPAMAMCTVCPDEPLVSTLERPRYEFTCMGCHSWFGFLDPRPAEATPELEAKHAQRKAEYEADRAAREQK